MEIVLSACSTVIDKTEELSVLRTTSHAPCSQLASISVQCDQVWFLAKNMKIKFIYLRIYFVSKLSTTENNIVLWVK